ncbi:hypothetical protein VTK26DRAFT_923 [Humicola hyalothermophila]
MDLGNLTQGALPASAANTRHEANNSTTSWLPHLPDDVLETLTLLLGPQFNPLLKLLIVLYNIVGGHFGFDPTYPLSAFGFIWAVQKFWIYLYSSFHSLARYTWDDEDRTGLITERVSSDSSNAYFNFSTQKTKAAPRFTPALGTYGFWFRGRYFRLHRKQESLYDANRPFGIP